MIKKSLMVCTGGGAVEIQSFVQIYNVNILIYRDDNSKPYEIGFSNHGVLTVFYQVWSMHVTKMS